jgi:hypothetical protein
MKNLEFFLKQGLGKIRKKGRFKLRGKCLNDQDVACIIDGQLSENERARYFDHVLSCMKCTERLKDHLLVLNAIDKKGMLETPEAIVQAAMDLYSPEVGVNVLEVVLNFKDKVIELVRTTGEILRGPELIPVPVLRSQDEDVIFPNEIKIVKEFNNMMTEVGVEKSKPYLCNVEIRLTEKKTKKKMHGLRVTLMRNGREIESSLIEEGKVIFREVKLGKYSLFIAKDDKKVGIVELDITNSK